MERSPNRYLITQSHLFGIKICRPTPHFIQNAAKLTLMNNSRVKILDISIMLVK